VAPPVLRGIKLLESIVKVCPGQLEAIFLLAKIKYIINEDDQADRYLKQCLKLNPAYSDVSFHLHTLIASKQARF
jgi:hypothetical protein